MPKNKNINSILIIGSGPIVIGQGCEFDYSGSQAAKALKKEGYRVILVNSNPATIMTDPEMADSTYIEPLTASFLEKIIKIEKPDALLPTLGGQTALNLAIELDKKNIFKKYNISLLGASIKSIEIAENRWKFKESMENVGIKTLKGQYVKNFQEGVEASKNIGFPLMLRPSYILGGGGTSIVENEATFIAKLTNAFQASPVKEVLVEESVSGWKEYELEVMRDTSGNGVVICGIENMDPMGIHTGDSITVSPIQTLSDKEYQKMRDDALLCLNAIGIATGGSNVQFAVNPTNGDRRIIEMNPRVSRSSALASKATGFPIAKFAALLAVGYSLTELKNDITGTTPGIFEPVLDYVVVKIPRFDFTKFSSASNILNTSMQSVGEVMAIASTFSESLTKAIRSLEFAETGIKNKSSSFSDVEDVKLEMEIKIPKPKRLFAIFEAFNRNWTVEKISMLSKIDPWFLSEIEKTFKVDKDLAPLSVLKKLGWTLENIDELSSDNYELNRVYKRVDTCSGEFLSSTPYLYSTNGQSNDDFPTQNKKVIIIGSGPNRIGQGIEFDYCCVHGLNALKENNIESILINSNPETVSTDYDTADKLYFEPLMWTEVKAILDREMPYAVITQLGGQTPLSLANKISESGYKIAGSSVDVIASTEDRNLFQKLCTEQGINQPVSATAFNKNDLINAVKKIGYPVLLRPSYVLGGEAMRIIQNDKELDNYLEKFSKYGQNNNIFSSGPLVVDEFLTDAIEVDVDLISDGDEVFIAGIMEQLEPAGIHSGDSIAVLPPFSIDSKTIKQLEHASKKLAQSLNVIGLLNIQFAIKENRIYVLEANPRASRTMPFVAKVTKNQIIKAGTLLMLGYSLEEIKKNTDYLNGKNTKVAVKMAIFPWSRFPSENILLGPEMKATGEVLGIGNNLGIALNKAYTASGINLSTTRGVFVSLSDKEKPNFLNIVNKFINKNFKIYATQGTSDYLKLNNITSFLVGRATEDSPTSLTILDEKLVSIVINTPSNANEYKDGWKIKRLAFTNGIAVVSSVREAEALFEASLVKDKVLSDIQAIQK